MNPALKEADVLARLVPQPAVGLPPAPASLNAGGFRGFVDIAEKLTNREVQRFWSKVTMTMHCWLWTGGIENGYGRFYIASIDRRRAAHRVSWEFFKGPLPEGFTLDHLCRNRACVNPGHLEVVTNRENVLRGEGITAQFARQTRCLRGHEYTPENTWVDKDGRRHCRVCRRLLRALKKGKA